MICSKIKIYIAIIYHNYIYIYMSFNYQDVNQIYKNIRSMVIKGDNASYIPDLHKVNPNIYAISI